MLARTRSRTRSLVWSRWQSICGRSIGADRNENGTGGVVAVLARRTALGNVAIEVDAAPIEARRRTRFQTTPSRSRSDLSDSASSRDGGSPARPAGVLFQTDVNEPVRETCLS